MQLYDLELGGDRHPLLVTEEILCAEDRPMQNPGQIAELAEVCFRISKKAEEYVYMFALDTKGNVLGVFQISKGSVNANHINPREIFIRAILCGAVNIVVLHNHPSGDVTPSEDDLKVCRRIREAGALLGIMMVDFIIVGKGFYSYAEENQCAE